MDAKAMAYFSSMNPLARKFVSDSQMVEKILSDKWETFDVNEKEEIFDDFFVSPEVRHKYEPQEKKYSYPESFPKLNIQSGEKIVVDDANDFWTWQDEHSAPFSWKSKSQQDLSLVDIDELSKPNAKASKPKKTSEEENAGVNMAKREFKYDTSKKSLWQDFFPEKLEEYEREIQHDDTEELIGKMQKDSHSQEALSISRKDSSKKGVNGSLSMKNGSTRKEHGSNIVSNNTNQGQQTTSEPQTSKLKSPKSSKKSPKLSLSSSFSKKKQGDGEVLVTKVKESLPKSKSNSSFSSKEEEEELNAFDNPLMSSGVSSLVQEEEDYSSSNTSSPSRKPLLKEPQGQKMDREPLQMRGLESLSHNEGFVNSELLAVADITKSSSEDFNDSSIPITGFDFLDQW